jgi:hypothetical protein
MAINGNVIPLYTHGNDRLDHDKNPLSSTNPLSVFIYSFHGVLIFLWRIFSFLYWDPWAKHLEGSFIRILYFSR